MYYISRRGYTGGDAPTGPLCYAHSNKGDSNPTHWERRRSRFLFREAPINASTHVGGRSTCQASCVRRFGIQANALDSAPCIGRRSKPSPLLYDDWFTQDGKRVRDPNFPLSADLCPQHRLDYVDHKQSHKCPRDGCRGTGVPASAEVSTVSERHLHAEGRVALKHRATSSDIHPIRGVGSHHPETKSVKICEQPDGPGLSADDPPAPEGDVIRRQPAGSISSPNRRLSTGAEQTRLASGSGASRKTEPYRRKAYHFDANPPIARESDMDATARPILRRDHPARRHTVAGPVQQAGRILSTTPTATTTDVPVAQGRIIASGGGPQLSNDTPLTTGPMDGRTSSLTQPSVDGPPHPQKSYQPSTLTSYDAG